MLEPFFNKQWTNRDNRARSLSISLLLLAGLFFAAFWMNGNSWTIRIGLDYLPEEISLPAWDIPSDLVSFSLGLPSYAFAEFFFPQTVLPPDWLYPVVLILFFIVFPLLAAAITYLEGIWFYGSLFILAAGVALFEPGMLNPAGISSQWITAFLVLFTLLPVFSISVWLSSWNMARRWWVLMLFYTISGSLFFGINTEAVVQSKISASLYLPVLMAALAFIILNATDVLHGVLILLTRGNGNNQSWLHFSVFSIFYLANFILIYLKNTGLLVLDIYYPNPFLLQIISMVAGFWVLPARESLISGDSSFGKGLFGLYTSLAIFFFMACIIGFGTANDLIIEVLEDGITLLNFCVGASFLLYVIINFFDLMQHGLRVHEVIFRPRYMPVSGVAVFGLGAVLLFILNAGYFPFYQAVAARYVLFGDQARREGKALLAEELYKQALSMESRNQRANLSLAVLYLETGNSEKAVRAAEQSLEKNPAPEAVLVMAQAYRSKGMKLEEILCLQDGARKFPEDGRLLNNTGIAFLKTIYKDSARYYFSRAAVAENAISVAKTNLGFLFLSESPEKHGSPDREFSADKDWASLNNQLVFANAAHEKSSSVEEVKRRFKDAPESIRAYLLYHSMLNQAINRDSTDTQTLLNMEDDSLRKYYAEPLEMARTLLRYRCGHVFSGMQNLIHLQQAGTHNRLDFNILLAQLYYEQGAYAASAEYFKKAASAGMKNAWYWYAVACLDAGKKEESLIALRESFPYLSEPDKIRVSILADGIGKNTFQQVAKRTDPEKSAFIKLNWKKITGQQLKDLIHLTSDKESARLLWKYCFDRAYRESRKDVCQPLLRYAESFFSKNKKWQEMLASIRPFYQDMMNQNVVAGSQKSALPSFILGRQAEKSGETEKAVSYFQQSLEEDPFNSRNACESVKGILKAGKKEMAYQKALDLTGLDPFNPEFLELYAEMALQNGLADFAFQCLPKLDVLAGPQRAEILKNKLIAELSKKGLPVPKPIIP